MMQFNNMPNKVAFITSYPPGICPIAAFTAHLVETMIPASYGAFEPIMIAVEPDVSRDYPDEVNFVIRKDFRSDYMEAADFINAGHGDVALVQHHFDIFGVGRGIGDLASTLDVPVITTLHSVPPNPPVCHYESLAELCDASAKVIVTNKHDFEVLNKQYSVSPYKVELIDADRSNNPFVRDKEWFYVGRQYWQLVSDQMHQFAGDLRSLQAAKEHSLLFE